MANYEYYVSTVRWWWRCAPHRATFRRWGKINVIIMHSHHEMCTIRFHNMKCIRELKQEEDKKNMQRIKWQLGAMNISSWKKKWKKKRNCANDVASPTNEMHYTKMHAEKRARIHVTRTVLCSHTNIIIHIRHTHFECKQTAAYADEYWYTLW